MKSPSFRAGCAVATLIFGGCASNVPPVTPQMAAAVGQPSSVLEHGRQLYAGPCTACHSPEPVMKHSASEWPKIVADMGNRAKLSAAERDAVLAYVLAVRSAPAPQG